MRDLRDGREVDQLEHRIGRGLDPQHAGVRPDRGLERLAVGQVDERRLQVCRALAHALQDPVTAAVEVVHAHEVRAAVERLEHGADRRHAGGEGETRVATLERGEAGFERIARRVARAGVVVTLMLAGTRLRVGGRRIDRRHHRAGARVGLLAGVDDLRLELHLFSHRCRSQLRRSMRVMRPRNSSPSTTIATMPRLKTFTSSSTVALGGTVTIWLSIASVTCSLKCSGLSYTSARMSSSSTMQTMRPDSSTGSCETS